MEQDPGGNGHDQAPADLAVQAAAQPVLESDAELLVLHVCDPNFSHDAADSEGSFVHRTEVMVNGPDDIYVERSGGSSGRRTV